MRYFRDTGILFLGGILPLCTLGLNRGLILAMLETVILICGSYFFDRKYTKILLWSIFAGIIFCNAGNKIVLSRIDLYSRKRTRRR